MTASRMSETRAADGLAALLAKEAIRDCLMRYARGIDPVDRALLETVYWPEASDDHGSMSGPACDFIDWVIPLLESMEQTSHFLGNILIDLVEDDARAETYFEAYHRVPRDGGDAYDVVMGGRYLDWFQARGGEWRIRDRVVVYDWVREFPDSADWTKPVLNIGFRTNRKGEDPSYRLWHKPNPNSR